MSAQGIAVEAGWEEDQARDWVDLGIGMIPDSFRLVLPPVVPTETRGRQHKSETEE
jgi:hypothetical protein